MELPRRVVWLGDTRRNLRDFPQPVRRDMGAALFAAQCGETAEHVKPFKGVGSGVMEIAERYATDALQGSLCCAAWEKHLCAARVSEKIEVWYRNAEKRR